jgi:hypothetical protein
MSTLCCLSNPLIFTSVVLVIFFCLCLFSLSLWPLCLHLSVPFFLPLCLPRTGQYVDSLDPSTHRHGCYCHRVYLAIPSWFIGMCPKTKGPSSPHLHTGNTETIPQLVLDSPDRPVLSLQNQEQGPLRLLEASPGSALCPADFALILCRRRTCNATSFALSPAKSF